MLLRVTTWKACPRVNLRKYYRFENPDIQAGLSMPDFFVVYLTKTLGQEISTRVWCH